MNIKFKKAIVMIELIIAIVIISIVLLAIPNLIIQSGKSIEVSLQQEAITINSSHTWIILSKYWDENNLDSINGFSPVLDINYTSVLTPAQSPSSNFIFDTIHQRNIDPNKKYFSSRIFKEEGDINFSKVSPSVKFGNTADLDSEFNTYDDIDDYSATNFSLKKVGLSSNTSKGEYVDINISLKTTVTYASHQAVITGSKIDANNILINKEINNTSHIKFIEVTLTTKEKTVKALQKNITLYSFSCNIGTYLPRGKVY